MEIFEKEKASPLTKVLVKNIHGGRKQDSKFWQSEFSSDRKKHSKKKGSSFRLQIAVLLLGAFVGAVIVTMRYGTVTVPLIYQGVVADVKHFFHQDASNEIEPIESMVKKKDELPNRVNSSQFSEEEIKRVVEKVLAEKRSEKDLSIKYEASQEHNNIPEYEYKIELDSGATVYSDNINIVGDEVSYTWDNGLIVSINKKHIISLN